MNLSGLNLSNEDFSDMDFKERRKLINIISLDISGNPNVSHSNVAKLFCNLEKLYLGITQRQHRDFKEGLYKFPDLLYLSFGRCSIEKIDFLDGPHSLKNLVFSNAHISKIEGLDSLVNLEELDFSDNDITKISGLDNLAKLEKLFISHNKLVRISGLDKLTNLKDLYVDYNKITEISGLDNLVNLEHIDLRFNLLTEIKGLGNLRKLEWLYLSGQEKNAPRKEVQKLGGLSTVGYALEPQNFVRYSRNEK